MHDSIDNSKNWVFARKCNRIWAIRIDMIWITAKMIINSDTPDFDRKCTDDDTGNRFNFFLPISTLIFIIAAPFNISSPVAFILLEFSKN